MRLDTILGSEVQWLGEAVANAAEGEAAIASTPAALTRFPDPTPLVRGVRK